MHRIRDRHNAHRVPGVIVERVATAQPERVTGPVGASLGSGHSMSDEPLLYDHTFEAGPGDHLDRLDVFLVRHFPGFSRSNLARQIKEGRVEVNGRSGKKIRPGRRIENGDVVRVALGQRTEPYARPEPIALDILHEDEWLLLINKPPGLTVHPGAGESGGTLANALAYHFGELSRVQGPLRPGIVHRLDKDTSGVILVAKDDLTHHALATQFRERTVKKEYLAIVKGIVELDADLISAPIGPHRANPTRMAVRLDIGKESETYYQVHQRLRGATWVRCHPRSGRTHQIRVHMASIRHPIVSDRVYGGIVRTLREFCPRQALHARRLTFRHPGTQEDLTVEAPIPDDIATLIAHLS